MDSLVASQQNEISVIDTKNWVTKSNELIESTYKLSLQEQRILLIMASKVQPQDETLKTYRFRAKEIIEIIGIKKGTSYYTHLKEVVNGLQRNVLTIKKDGIQRNYSWLITSIYEENEGYVTLQFHPELKDFFLELKEKFTTYQLENVVSLNSVYSIRIYELLKQYEKIKKREMTVQELRNYLAIEVTKYKQYGHFKSKVLLVAQKEINMKTDIQMEFTEIKTGRKVTSIEFRINSRVNKKVKELPVINTDNDVKVPIKEQLISLKVPNDKLDWLLNEFSEEQIKRNIQYVLNRNEKGEIQFIGSYTVKAIQNDYGKVSLKTEKSPNSREQRKAIRTEVLPDWLEKNKLLENGALEQKQALYFEERGLQEEFESKAFEIRIRAVEMEKELFNVNDEERLKEIGMKAIINFFKNDNNNRKIVGLEPQEVSDILDPELRDIYKYLLEELINN
ncbi:replication initiation protein [Bacillus cihuensis]|uniref:replication initiation protein n=1 Tax=Bacillus cihuensis TaxID=1208599 RepID=UPI0003FCAD13|nr:replication initiation protein [Bacillus cihuensis]